MLSSDGSTIYSLFTYGGSIFRYLYFCGLSVSDGRVTTTRYKSDDGIAEIYGSALNGDYIVATSISLHSILIYSISSSTFTIKYLSSGFTLYG